MSGINKRRTLSRKQAFDALLADVLQAKAIPEEHDDLVIGIAEATRRQSQREIAKAGVRRRQEKMLARRQLVRLLVTRLPPAGRAHLLAGDTIAAISDQLHQLGHAVAYETLVRDLKDIK